MKQLPTRKQVDSLSPKARKILLAYVTKKMDKGDWTHVTLVDDCLPLLNVGQMIERLIEADVYIHISYNHCRWKVTIEDAGIESEFIKKELVVALFAATKEVLEG